MTTLISKDPTFILTEAVIAMAKIQMEGFADGYQFELKPRTDDDKESVASYDVSEKPRFICSVDFQFFVCPHCGECIYDEDELPDYEADEEMSSWEKFKHALITAKDPTRLKIKLPCCEAKVAVTALNFEDEDTSSSAGFSTFTLRVTDHEFSACELAFLEKIIGCQLIQVVD